MSDKVLSASSSSNTILIQHYPNKQTCNNIHRYTKLVSQGELPLDVSQYPWKETRLSEGRMNYDSNVFAIGNMKSRIKQDESKSVEQS